MMVRWTMMPIGALAILLSGGDVTAQSAVDGGSRMGREMELLRQEQVRGNEAATSDRAELKSFLSRLPGRFRIEGSIEQGYMATLRSKITGVADCAGIGTGSGVHCAITASWPVLDRNVAQIGAQESPSEMLNTFRPAVLALGVESEGTRARVLLVTADSIANSWSGALDGNTLEVQRLDNCMDPRCFRTLTIDANPGTGVITLSLPAQRGIVITLTMYPDVQAHLGGKVRSLKSR
jgi:hypothetical protein